MSYMLSRALEQGEQLDWSGTAEGVERRDADGGADEVRRDVDPYCGLYDHSVYAGQGTGCVGLEKTLTCFRLWHY